MNILITAGGTCEPVDRVRSITNTGTGKLGSLIADFAAQNDKADKIFYIHAKNAVLPSSERIALIPIGSTQELEDAVRELAASERIDVIIHSMAVSDYSVRSVICADALTGTHDSTEDILNLFDANDMRRHSNKLSSSMENPVILLQPTKKVLPLMRSLMPQAVLVGFKLLDHVPEEELLSVAQRLLEHNGCDYVLANDYATVEAGAHEGILIDRSGTQRTFIGKENIARGIITTLMEENNK